MRSSACAPFVDARVEDLALSLEEVEIDALATLVVPLPGGSLELRVLGASHQAVLATDGHRFSETMACGVEGERPVDQSVSVLGLDYRFTCAIDPVVDAAAVASDLENSLAADPDGLVVAFPGSPHALTGLRLLDRSPRRCAWATWHLYPDAAQVIVTTSRARW